MPGTQKYTFRDKLYILAVLALVGGTYLCSAFYSAKNSPRTKPTTETQSTSPMKDVSSTIRVKPSDVAVVPIQQGDLAISGGTPTVRKAFVRAQDDPLTTNDESNDQPVGHFGTATLVVHSVESGNTYTLDAEINGNEVERIYFPKGGWVDLVSSEIDSSGNGSGTDEKGRNWEFEGFDSGSASSITEEESEVEAEE